MKAILIPGFVSLAISAGVLLGAQAPSRPVAIHQESSVRSVSPKGLNRSDWSAIRNAYEMHRHGMVAHRDGTHVARNPGQAWLATFDGRGFTLKPDHGNWSWGLELYAECNQPVTVEGNRLICPRGGNIEEWFLNDDVGLEQGWIIRSKDPKNTDNLVLDLKIRGSLVPRISSDQLAVSFQTGDAATVLNYGGLRAWDAERKPIAARFAQGADQTRLAIVVEDAGAVYPITIDPTAQQAYLKASNTDPGDNFGFAVAVSGDTVVVGAPRERSTGAAAGQANNGGNQVGAAYVFVRDGGGNWSQQAYLKASNAASFHLFGSSVAASGDTVVVGTGNGGTSESVYVFVRSGTVWSQQQLLQASNFSAFNGDNFGNSVSISGDTLIVGADREDSSATGVGGNQSDNSASSAGAAYVFTRSGSTWSQQAYLKASNTAADDNFGISVSVSGDTVVVGANGEDSSATGVGGLQGDNSASAAGAAYIFTRSGTAWSQQAYLKASNTEADDGFGFAVSASGDTAVIGAPGEDSSSPGVNGDQGANDSYNGGAAYVFVRSSGLWSQQAYLKAAHVYDDPSHTVSDSFGTSVSVSGDRVIVGAPGESSAGTGVDNFVLGGALNSGAAFVFSRSSTTWSQLSYLKASNTNTNDRFGVSVSVAGDTAIAGANIEASSATGVNGDGTNNAATTSGASYVFLLGAPPVLGAILITDCSLSGTDFTIHFTAEVGTTTWRVMGSVDLDGFPDDLTAVSSITETSPGIYEVIVDLSGHPERYFVRIER